MSVAIALRRSAMASFSVHALRSVLALLLTTPLVNELPRVAATPNDAALTLVAFVRHRELGPIALTACAAYALLVPFASVAWLTAMSGASGRESARHGARAYSAALALAVAGLLALLGIALLSACVLEYAPRYLPASVAAEGALSALVAGAVGLGVLVIATLYDLGCAVLADALVRPRIAIRRAWRAFSFRVLLRHFVLIAASASILFAGELAGRALSAHAGWLVLPLQQLALFANTLLRAAWLAIALDSSGSLSPR